MAGLAAWGHHGDAQLWFDSFREQRYGAFDRALLDRIARLDDDGPGLNAVLALDPRATMVARELDAPRYHVAEAFERAALAALMLSVSESFTTSAQRSVLMIWTSLR